MNLFMQGAFDPNRPVRSIPTSKNSAVARVFGPEVLSWVDHGVEMETVFDLEQKLAVMSAVRQSAPPVAVTFASGLLPPTHLNALRVVTVPPVENSPTNSTSPRSEERRVGKERETEGEETV